MSTAQIRQADGCDLPMSRRSILGTIAALPVITLPAIPAASLGVTAWVQAHAQFRAADAVWDRFIETIHNPAIATIDRLAPMPPTSFTHTALSGQVATFSVDSSNPTAWDDAIGVIGKKGRQAQAAYDAWRQRYEQLSLELRLDELEEEEAVFCDQMVAAREIALVAPVNSLSELLEKVAFIKEQHGEQPNEDHLDAILADLRLLDSQKAS